MTTSVTSADHRPSRGEPPRNRGAVEGAGGSESSRPLSCFTISCLTACMELEFSGDVVEWRGPAPYYFVPLPLDAADLVDEVKAEVVYWGVVPVRAWIGGTEFTTSMFPREETWFLPVKDAVRRAEGIGLGDVVDVRLEVGR